MNRSILLLSTGSASGEALVKMAGGRSQTKLSITGIWPPTELLVMGAMLKKENYEVELLDSNSLRWTHEKTLEKLSEINPGIIILFSTTPTFFEDLALSKKIKESLKEVTIIFYGIHVTCFPDEVERDEIDYIIRREPELTTLELCKAIMKNGKVKKIAGISYKDNGKVVHNPDRPFIEDLDTLPFPAYEMVNSNDYTIPGLGEKYALVQASRGCPHNCIFCNAFTYYGRKWRGRSPKRIFSEVQFLYEKEGIRNFHLSSDLFTNRKKEVIELCNMIIDSGMKIKWVCNSRADTVDQELLDKMKESGCWLMSFGIESGDQEILNGCKKALTVEDIKKGIGYVKQAGIQIYAYFIIGLPGENRSSAQKTINLSKELDPDYAKFYIATPIPGSAFFSMAVDNGWMEWEQVVSGRTVMYEGHNDVLNYPDLSGEEISALVKKGYREFYLRPKYILKELRKIKNPKDFVDTARTGVTFLKNWFM